MSFASSSDEIEILILRVDSLCFNAFLEKPRTTKVPHEDFRGVAVQRIVLSSSIFSLFLCSSAGASLYFFSAPFLFVICIS